MKLKHRIPQAAADAAWKSYDGPIDDRYAAELETARRHAERAHRKAERRLALADRRYAARPTPELWSARDELRMVVLARLQEIRDIEELMRPAVTGSNHSGKGSVRAVPKGRTL